MPKTFSSSKLAEIHELTKNKNRMELAQEIDEILVKDKIKFKSTTFKNPVITKNTTKIHNRPSMHLQAKRINSMLIGNYNTPASVCGVAVFGNTAYVAAYDYGLQIINVATPTSPVLLGAYDTPAYALNVVVSGNIAYVADTSSGLQIINVAIPATPTFLSAYNTPGSAIDVTISGTRAYVADQYYGLQIINVASPTNPTLLGTYDTPGEAAGVFVSGNVAYVADWDYGLHIINVAVPASPTLLGTYNTPGYARGIAVSGGIAYVADWDYGLQIISVTAPASPSLLGTYNTPGTAFSLAISGNVAYVTDWDHGLQMINVESPISPTLLGVYDTLGNARRVAISGNTIYLADDNFGLKIIDTTAPNEEPILLKNQLKIAKGQVKVLAPINFNATDIDSSIGALIFRVSNVTSGYFDLTIAPSVSVTSFTQNQIIASQVRFTHDGTEAPSYKVTVDDGYGAVPVPASAASIIFENKPIITQNQLIIGNGQVKFLTASELAASDVDLGGDQSSLRFMINNLQHGQFYSSVLNAAVTKFLQRNITSSHIRFIHDGSSIKPAYNVTVSDGVFSSPSLAAAISFNNSPAIVNNHLTISQGQRVIITTSDISATDDQTAAGSLIFSISNIQHGQFEYAANNGISITTFTQQDVIDSKIRFVHDNSAIGPSYNLMVSDGSLTAGPQAATITYTNINNAPVLITNKLTIQEGQTVTLSATELKATDSDSSGADLILSTGNVKQGQFYSTSTLSVVSSFAQRNITQGHIQFIHDGGGLAPGYDVTVSDGQLSDGPHAAAITFTQFNDAPVIVNNNLTITQGQTVTLTPSAIRATDVDNSDSSLTLTVSGVQHGYFEHSSNAGVIITSFTQADINSSLIRFVHDNSEVAPSYNLMVSDGSLTAGPQAASITYTNINNAPVLITNKLTIQEGQTVTLSAAELKATDSDSSEADLILSTGNVKQGQFYSTSTRSVISSFAQRNITQGHVQFIHDGSELAPDYDITVSDGQLSDGPHSAAITFTQLNDTPILLTNKLAINQGQTVVLTAADLSATDKETAADELLFTASTIERGHFEDIQTPGTQVTTFTQQKIAATQIQFIADDSGLAPTYNMSVSDGYLSSASDRARIAFKPKNALPDNSSSGGAGDGNDNNAALIGGIVGGIGAAALLTGLGFFYCKKKKLCAWKNKEAAGKAVVDNKAAELKDPKIIEMLNLHLPET